MIDKYISITIRPTYEEFITLKNPMDTFIQWLEPEEYICALEKGTSKRYNHYQMGLKTHKHIDSIRRKVDNIFKPYLSNRTQKLNIWRKVKTHNDSVSLIGYCAKEGKIYKTNIEKKIIDEELIRYNTSTRGAKKIQVIHCHRRFCICGSVNCCKLSFDEYIIFRKKRRAENNSVASGIGEAKEPE